MSLLAWGASAAGASSVPPGAVVTTALPVTALFLATVAAGSLRRRKLPAPAASALFLAVVAAPLAVAQPARAHDPGQGRIAVPVRLEIRSDGQGALGIQADVADWPVHPVQPVRVVARRAGRTVTGPLDAAGDGRFTGRVRVPAGGRWFVYTEFRSAGRPVEGWLAVEAGRPRTVAADRDLYLPAGTAPPRAPQVAAPVVLYTISAALLVTAVWLTRRRFATGVSGPACPVANP